MQTTIILIRHGETAWNREKRFRGSYDVPLNDNGRAQARLCNDMLNSRKIDAVYSSPLSRTRETAELAIGRSDIQIQDEQGFIDIDYGDWTGNTEEEVKNKWPREFEKWKSKPESLRIPGGNTLEEVYNNGFNAMEAVALKHPGQTIAIFSHRVVNKLLVLGALGLGLDRFPFIIQDNCCINEFERIEQGYLIRSLNDVSHMRNAGVDVLKADF